MTYLSLRQHLARSILLLVIVACAGCAGAKEAASPGAASAHDASGQPGYGQPPPDASGQPGYGYSAEGDPMNAKLYAEQDSEVVNKAMSTRSGMAQAQAAPPQSALKHKSAPTQADVPGPSAAPEPKPGIGTGNAIAGPLLIYTARLHMAVFEATQAIDAAEKLAKESGGYLVRRNDRSITVRIPAGKFQGALEAMVKLGDVLHRHVSVQDITEQFFDLQIRLRNAEVVRDRLEELLKRAQKVEEALAVERQLERVAGEIERMKGRLRLFQELVAFSTITLQFQPRPVDHVESNVGLPFPWLGSLGLGGLLSL